jgi:hypothetical protein
MAWTHPASILFRRSTPAVRPDGASIRPRAFTILAYRASLDRRRAQLGTSSPAPKAALVREQRISRRVKARAAFLRVLSAAAPVKYVGRERNQQFFNFTATIGVRRHRAHTGERLKRCPRIKALHRRMVRVADNNERAAMCGAQCGVGKTLLVGPGEIPLVVTNETVVIVGNCVGRIAVNYIPRSGGFHDRFKIAYL